MNKTSFEKGSLSVEIIVLMAVVLLLGMFLLRPMWYPMVEKSDEKKAEEFYKNATSSFEVTILDKQLIDEVSPGYRGTVNRQTKKFISFELKDGEYFVYPQSREFFNYVKKDGKMKVYMKDGDSRMLGEAPNGKKAFLTSY